MGPGLWPASAFSWQWYRVNPKEEGRRHGKACQSSPVMAGKNTSRQCWRAARVAAYSSKGCEVFQAAVGLQVVEFHGHELEHAGPLLQGVGRASANASAVKVVWL